MSIVALLLVDGAFPSSPSAADDSRSSTVAITVVDETGEPVAGATVQLLDETVPGGGAGASADIPPVKTDAAGVCRIPRALGVSIGTLFLVATDGSGARQGYLERKLRDPVEVAQPLRIVLRAAREATIRVIDQNGAAVGDATVGLQGPQGRHLAAGRTDNGGSVRLKYPPDVVVESVFAFKAGQGFDFWKRFGDEDSAEDRNLPQALKLTMNGAQTVRIRAIDSAGQPVSGLAVYPWAIVPPGRTRRNILINSHLVDTITDEAGVALIDWLPIDLVQVDFIIRSTKYGRVGIPRLLEANVRDVTIPVLRMTKISGHVKGADGKPAAGICVRTGSTLSRGSALTGDDGAYELNVTPDRGYVVLVVDADWAARPRGAFVREDEPVGGIDFELTKGTVVRGTVTKSRDRSPAAKVLVTLDQSGDELLHEVYGPGAKPRSANRLQFSHSVLTDSAGRFQFRVGPGNYLLTNVYAGFRDAGAREQFRLTIGDEPEVTVELHAFGLETSVLAGTVVGPDGAPVNDAVVQSIDAGSMVPDSRSGPPKTSSNAAGRFEIARKAVPLWLIGSSAGYALTGRVRVEAEQDSVTLTLAPAATVVGRLFEDESPVEGAQLVCNASFPIPGRGTLSSSSQVATTETAPDGRFVIPGLIVGERYSMRADKARPTNAELLPEGTWVSRAADLPSFKVERSGNIDMGYVKLPLPRRVNPVPRGTRFEIDFSELATNRFNDKTDFATRLSAARGDAKREYRRVMLVVGDPKSNGTQSVAQFLFKLVEGFDGADHMLAAQQRKAALGEAAPENTDELTRPLTDFQRVHVNVRDEAAAAHLARACQLDVAKIALPALMVLAEDGTLAAQQSFAGAGGPPQLDVEALREFLKRNALPARNAEELMRGARRRAHDENKSILLQHSSPGSYPCRLLTRFIARHLDLLERDYVYVTIDAYRSIKGTEVIEQFRKPGGAVPWLAILNSDGFKLADSDSPSGNIGFPSESEAINYFVDQMLKPTAQRLTAEELEDLRTALSKPE